MEFLTLTSKNDKPIIINKGEILTISPCTQYADFGQRWVCDYTRITFKGDLAVEVKELFNEIKNLL